MDQVLMEKQGDWTEGLPVSAKQSLIDIKRSKHLELSGAHVIVLCAPLIVHRYASSMDHAQIINKAIAAVRPVFRLRWHHGAHGTAQWSRVWYHGRRLARSVDVNPAILAWFAYLHDGQRHNEYSDPSHGRRAADFALQLHKEGTLSGAECD
jgi:hypothetical protein